MLNILQNRFVEINFIITGFLFTVKWESFV